jgi:hypothetical protein
MAVYKIFPTQDATLYSAYPSMNTGIDEIIEATTNFKTGSLQINGDLPQVSRFLIQFNPSDLNYVSSSLIGTSSWDANLKVFELIDESKNDTGLAKITDDANYERHIAKMALQKRFFDSELILYDNLYIVFIPSIPLSCVALHGSFLLISRDTPSNNWCIKLFTNLSLLLLVSSFSIFLIIFFIK